MLTCNGKVVVLGWLIVAAAAVGAGAAVTGGKIVGTDTAGTPQVLPGTPANALRLSSSFFQSPSVPFITGPGEQVVDVKLGTLTGEAAQQLLNAARATAPDAVLVVSVEGTITISTLPLMPTARTCFVFRNGGRIMAAPGCSAGELVLIKDAEYVSFSGVGKPQEILDGKVGCRLVGAGAAVVGIRIENSGKVNLDGLLVSQCGGGGVAVSGRGAERYADGVSLTRSTISGCGTGVVVRQSTQFMGLDNRIINNTGAGMNVGSPGAILANNICAANGTGMVCSAKNVIISRNQLIANGTGLRLTPKSELTLVYENAIQDNQVGLVVAGKTASIGWNTLLNTQQLNHSGQGTLLTANRGLTAAEACVPGASYFNPPTADNPHREPVIWKGSGAKDTPMERFDLTVTAGATPMDVGEVATRLAEARVKNPGKVLVATLVGNFVVRAKAGLRLPDHTCVLLSGTIKNESSTEPREQLVLMNGKGCVSFSGGQIGSASKVMNALNGQKSNNALLIDGVSINLSATDGHQGSGSLNAVSGKQHSGPFLVRGCEIRDPGSRGIWAHVSSRIYILGNRFFAGGMTIDFDAACTYSAALYNTVSGGNYHSAIFFEEGVKYNTAFANHCLANNTAIAVWCEAVKGVTKFNTIACNLLADNGAAGGADLGIGGRAADKRADNNYAFNNRFVRNVGRGGVNLKVNAIGNYITQSVFTGCKIDIANWSTQPRSSGYENNCGFAAPTGTPQ